MRARRYFVVSVVAALLASSAFGGTAERIVAAVANEAKRFVEKTVGSSSRIPSRGTVEVAFSPGGNIGAMVINAINEVENGDFLLVSIYTFTHPKIAEALAKAHARGVMVRVIADRSMKTAKYSAVTYLLNHKVPVRFDRAHPIQHNKLLISGDIVGQGSFNFTERADKENSESFVIHRGNPDLVKAFVRDWEVHWRHSEEN